MSHDYDTVPTFTEAEQRELHQHAWYHGCITQLQAEAALKSQTDNNGFLVRVLEDNAVLSKRICGWVSHDTIHRRPGGGYRLERQETVFTSIPEMIAHYQSNPVDNHGQVLGTGIATVPSGQ